ncbi:hypothetical protein CP981_00165 [Streptomyces platensis]|uniref:Uncharacterized protein n=1 Tax=Streptomyces platensis TaxID=58346 RepID=A0AAE6TKB4_STRPT|nr:hypothetical protein CP981_00165 [Streptomyces platensis]
MHHDHTGIAGPQCNPLGSAERPPLLRLRPSGPVRGLTGAPRRGGVTFGATADGSGRSAGPLGGPADGAGRPGAAGRTEGRGGTGAHHRPRRPRGRLRC